MPGGQRTSGRVMSTRRLEAFTDGIFAIAATLLVLDLTTEDFGVVTSDGQLIAKIVEMTPQLFSFALSFTLLCVLWSVHRRQFETIRGVDGVVIGLNNVRLFGVVAVPFATSLSAEYSAYIVGRMSLPFVFFFIVTASTAQWLYVASPRRGLIEGLSEEEVEVARRSSWVAMAIVTAVLVSSAWIGPAAFALFFARPIIEAAIERRRRRARGGTASGDQPRSA